MTPAEALAQHQAFVNEIGEDVTVRRYSGTGASRTASDTTAKARVMGYAPHELVGNVRQGDRKLIMLADALSSLLPLRTTDFIVIRGAETSVQAVDDNTRRIGGTLIALEVQVRG